MPTQKAQILTLQNKFKSHPNTQNQFQRPMLMNKKKKNMILKKLPSLFFKSSSDGKSTWPWPSCQHPRTLSFRTNAVAESSVCSFFTLSSESSASSLSTASDFTRDDPVERMIKGLRSDRLLFEPAGKSRSIMKEDDDRAAVRAALKDGTTVLAVDSDEPYWDFRKSMEEMVEAYGMKDWESLEELLSWYLRVNEKNNHGFIFAAFVDLLVTLAMAASSSLISEKFVISPLLSDSCCSSSSSNNLPAGLSSSMEI